MAFNHSGQVGSIWKGNAPVSTFWDLVVGTADRIQSSAHSHEVLHRDHEPLNAYAHTQCHKETEPHERVCGDTELPPRGMRLSAEVWEWVPRHSLEMMNQDQGAAAEVISPRDHRLQEGRGPQDHHCTLVQSLLLQR